MINYKSITNPNQLMFYTNEEVEELLNYLNREYRKGNSLVSDPMFDGMESIYKKKNPTSEYFKKIGATPITRERKLPVPMASMSKVKSLLELKRYFELKRISEDELLVITPKLDGGSCLYNELNGEACTRGDGEIGQDITAHMKSITCPHGSIENGVEFSVGEVIISRKSFKLFSKERVSKGFDKPSNPRNSTTGSFGDDVPVMDKIKYIDYIRYHLPKMEHLTKVEMLELCNKFNTIKIQYEVKKLSELTSDYLYNLYKQWGVEYEIDGLIIEFNSPKIRKELGLENSTNNPAFARAYKANFETRKEVVLRGIEVNVSKQGNMIPVGVIDKTHLDGVNIEKITFSNFRNVVDLSLFPGELITFIRSGGVIPKAVGIAGYDIPFAHDFETTEEYNLAYETLVYNRQYANKNHIKNCPSCGTKLIWGENDTHLVCPNHDNCPDQQFYKVLNFFKTLEVENFGEPTLEVLFKAGFKTVQSIVELTVDDFLKLEGFQDGKANKLYKSIGDKLKNVKIEKLMHASNCFKKLGSKKIKLILENLGSNLHGVDGLGEELINDYHTNLQKYNQFYLTIKPFVTIAKNEVVETKVGKYSGQFIVFTQFRDKDLEEKLTYEGATIQDSVNKQTTMLIYKDNGKTSSKIEKAAKQGIQIIEINNFKF